MFKSVNYILSVILNKLQKFRSIKKKKKKLSKLGVFQNLVSELRLESDLEIGKVKLYFEN